MSRSSTTSRRSDAWSAVSGRSKQVVEDQDVDSRQRRHPASDASVASSDGEVVEQPWGAHVESGVPLRMALCASAQAKKVLPTPVGPTMTTLWWLPTQAELTSEANDALSSPRVSAKSTSSTTAPACEAWLP